MFVRPGEPHRPGSRSRDPVPTEGSWGSRMVDELQPSIEDGDIHIEKVRMSGFYGTYL